MTVTIKTESGAVYYLTGNKMTGGSKNLKDGALVTPPSIGTSMLILTPERAHLNPHYRNPAVITTPVVSIEPGKGI